MPVLSGKKVIKVLAKFGFVQVRRKGSHIVLAKKLDNRKISFPVPNHKEIDKGLLLEIIRQAELTKDEFLDLL